MTAPTSVVTDAVLGRFDALHDPTMAEQAILSAMLQDADAARTAIGILDSTMFVRDAHRRLFRAMGALMERGIAVDVVTVHNEFNGDLEAAGGAEYLAVLLDAVPTAANIANHAALVQRQAAARRAVTLAGHVADVLERGDWAAAEVGTIELGTVVHATGLAQAATANGWRWYSPIELADLPPLDYLVEGYLPVAGLALLYGPTGSYKTFAALDFACHIATGDAYHGEPVRQGPVAYIVGEGLAGLSERIAAWASAHEVTGDLPIRFLPQAVRMLDAVESVRLLRELGAWDPAPRLVVLDTFNWMMTGGDENSAADVGRYLATINHLRNTTGAAILTQHHTGHDKTRERGSSALAAAMDVVIAAKRDESGCLVLTNEKMRDAAPFEPLRFTMRAEGRSLVPQLVIGASASRKTLTRSEQTALDALRSITLPGDSVPISRWDQLAGLGHGTFYRAVKRLVELGLVVKERKRYRPATYDTEVPGPSEVPF